MLENRPEDALGSLVQTVYSVETVQTLETAETVQTVQTVESLLLETVQTEDMKKYELLTHLYYTKSE